MKLYFLTLFSIAVAGCNPSKKVAGGKKDGLEDAIQIAILDFSKTRKLYKKDSVFSILINNATKNDGILVLEIGRNNTKLLLTKDAKIGSKGKLPSKYLEKDGKLFFWWDDNMSLTSETLSVLGRYGLLEDDENGKRKAASFIIDETQKAAHYYFCKNDISKYKRVLTNIGLGYYDYPLLDCGQ